MHPHQLRHGFASNVLDAGGALDEAQELLGHADVARHRSICIRASSGCVRLSSG